MIHYITFSLRSLFSLSLISKTTFRHLFKKILYFHLLLNASPFNHYGHSSTPEFLKNCPKRAKDNTAIGKSESGWAKMNPLEPK